MKERGKSIRNFPDLNCSKHHYSHIGICPHCLTERLRKLVCSDCGKSRVWSCSCSYFIDGEKGSDIPDWKGKRRNQKVVLLRRSNSSCVEEVEKKNGFWGLFGKKRRYKINGDVPRSVSFSNAKISDVLEMEIDGLCSFAKQSVFPIRGSDLSHVDDDDDAEFIDLKLDSKSKSNRDFFFRGGGGGGGGDANSCRNGNSEIGGNLASLKTKWGLWKKGFLQGSKK